MKNDIIKSIKAILADNDMKDCEVIEKIKAAIEESEKPNLSEMEAGERFTYCDREWIFLGMEQGGALCITAESYAEMPFDKDSCNDWRKSSLRKELTEKFLPTLDGEDLLPFEMDLIADNGDKSYGKCTDMVGILNCDLYRKYRDHVPLFDEWMWTCTPWNCNPGSASIERYVYTDGSVYSLYAFNSVGVVPACIFKISNP